MKLLAIDTATEACSAALLLGETVLARYAEPRRGHAELILPMVQELLAEGGVRLEDLTGLVVGRGPGAFTGVRIAISVTQGLAYGADRQVAPVSDLAALALRARDLYGARQVLACLDARMGEVYWAAFEADADGLVRAVTAERVDPPTAVSVEGDGWYGAGRGLGAHPLLAHGLSFIGTDVSLLPRAQEIARLGAREFRAGRAVPPEQALPVYVRDRVTHTMSSKSQT